MRRLAVIGTLVAAALAFPSAALAHGIVGRTDLPIPVWLFGWAAAVVLIVSFVALGSLWPTPRLQVERLGRPLVRLPVLVDVVLGALGVALFGFTVYAGLAGVDDAFGNLAPTMIYVLFWVGMVVLSVLFGNVFRLLSPWRAIARAVSWTARKVLGTRAAAGGRVPGLARPLARRDRALRVRLRRARLPQPRRPDAARDHGARLRGGDARRHGLVRHRDLERAGRPRSASTSGCSRGCRRSRAATGCCGCGRRWRARRRSTSCRAPSRCSRWRSAPPPSTASPTGRSGGRSRRTSSRSSGTSAADRRRSSRWASLIGLIACVLLVAGFYRLGIGGMVTVGGGSRREGAGRPLRPHAHPDRVRLRARPLLLAARLPGAGGRSTCSPTRSGTARTCSARPGWGSTTA